MVEVIEEGMGRLVLAKSPEDEASGDVPGEWTGRQARYYHFDPLAVPSTVVIQVNPVTQDVIVERDTPWPWLRRRLIPMSDLALIGVRWRLGRWIPQRSIGISGQIDRMYVPTYWEVYLKCSSAPPVQIAKGRDWKKVRTIADKAASLLSKEVDYFYELPSSRLRSFLEKVNQKEQF